ncbi:MAG: SDR family NAD(P)-dependent oxidoreductase [Thermoanaerobaculia bacterium]
MSVAVVSGAGSGIGLAVAQALGERGLPVVALGRRREPLAAAIASCAAGGLAVPCDVRDPVAVAAAARLVAERFGAVRVLVPAAGVARVAPFETLAEESLRESLEVNLLGVIHLARAFWPALARDGRAVFTPILSAAATRGFPGWSAYCASKWGLRGFLAALREEARGGPTRIAAIYPGATASALWEEVPGEWNRERMIPPSEVARAVLYALDAPAGVAIEEIHLQPAGGDL